MDSMRRLTATAACLVLLFGGCSSNKPEGGPKGDAGKEALEKFQGEWVTTLVALDTVQGTEEEAKATRLSVKGDRYTLTQADGMLEGTLKLDPTRKPAELDLTLSNGPDRGKTI